MSDNMGDKKIKRSEMGLFERYLTLWVALCIVAGIGLGHLFPNVFQTLGRIEAAHINLPVAVLVWLMIIPMLLKIDLSALKGVTQHWRGVGVTLFINWGVKPFSMALLAWFFIGYLFRDYLPGAQIDSYIAGLIILAAAPCTAMVFVWSHLMRGEPHFTLAQVALNDVCFRPYCWTIAGPFRYNRTMGHATFVSITLYRRTTDHCQPMAA